MRHRMAVAVLALCGLLVSAYLLLYKLGVIGSMVCGVANECERVQASRYSVFLGLPVAAYGVGGYVVLLVLSVYGLQASQISRPAATRWLAGLSALGVVFSLYLLSLELFVIHAICRWCSVSGVLILAICAVSVGGLVAASRAPAP
jgi:uncharacterized membrane protein